MSHAWWLPQGTWYAMTPEAQRLHRINVRAYFISQQREKEGVLGNPESDWATAEWEEDRRIEACGFYTKFRNSIDREGKVRYAVLYQISDKLHLRAVDINDSTPLPAEQEKRQQLGHTIGWEVINNAYQIPAEIGTVGELIETLIKTPPVVRLPTVRWQLVHW